MAGVRQNYAKGISKEGSHPVVRILNTCQKRNKAPYGKRRRDLKRIVRKHAYTVLYKIFRYVRTFLIQPDENGYVSKAIPGFFSSAHCIKYFRIKAFSFAESDLHHAVPILRSLLGHIRIYGPDHLRPISVFRVKEFCGGFEIFIIEINYGLTAPVVGFKDIDTGPALEDVAMGVYDVHLSGKSVDTLFERSYREEVKMQYVDNINILYVAFTRAARAMTVLSPMPEGEGFAEWTYAFMEERGSEMGFVHEAMEGGGVAFRKGGMPEPPCPKSSPAEKIAASFCSYEGEKGRLRLSEEAYDFFSDDGKAGLEASNRIRGVVLHDVLSRIVIPSDLEDAVRSVMLEGGISVQEAEGVRTLIESAIDSVKEFGWFSGSPDRILNEVELIDSDGRVYRPDRVVISGRKVSVIDFKFGEHRPEYERQVRRYADIWMRMGYEEASAYLWYVQSGEVMRIL